MLFLFYKSYPLGNRKDDPIYMFANIGKTPDGCSSECLDGFGGDSEGCYLFDSKNNKKDEVAFSYPVVVGWKYRSFLAENEDDFDMHDWALIDDEGLLEVFLNNIRDSSERKLCFIFECKDDILENTRDYVISKEKKRRQEFEEKMSKGVHFKGDIVITDPCYINYWENKGIFTDYLERDTIYGDWSCTVYNKDTDEVLGKFCADGGMVGCFYLNEALKSNPDFATYGDWTRTIIKDFDGIVRMPTVVEDNDRYTYVEGIGNINFRSVQTGL